MIGSSPSSFPKRGMGIAAAALLLAGTALRAQPAPDSTATREGTPSRIRPENWITIHPLPTIFGIPFTTDPMITVSYYRALIPEFVVGVGAAINERSPDEGYGASLDLRYYQNGAGVRGTYFSANASYKHVPGQKLHVTTVGGLIGYHWFVDAHFTANFGLGYDYYMPKYPIYPWSFEGPTYIKGSMLAVQLEIGYAW